MWAGYLALANQQAVSNSDPTLGFINPALYAIWSWDRTMTPTSTTLPVAPMAMSATVGYDLASGWGSMNGATLINTLAGGAPQTGSFSLSA
jgi:hypothetical protein